MSAGRTSVVGLRRAVATTLVAWALAQPGSAQSHPAAPPCGGHEIAGPTECTLSLAPQAKENLTVAMGDGKTAWFTAQQVAGSVEIRAADAPGPNPRVQTQDPFANHAGISSKIEVLFSGASSSRRIMIENPGKQPASILVTVSADVPPGPTTGLEQAAEAAFAHAEVLRTQGNADPKETDASFDRAIENWTEAGNKAATAQALAWKADYLVSIRGDATAAAPVIARALDLVLSLSPIEAAHCWLVAGFVNVVAGKYEEGSKAYNSALDLYRKAGDISLQAKALDNRARIEFMEGNAATATTDELSAADLAKKCGDTRREVFVQEELGAIYSTLGDFEATYRAYNAALEQLKLLPPEPRIEAAIWVDFSDLYTTLGDLDRVKDALDQAAAIWKRLDFPVGQVDTLNNYGDLSLLRGQFVEARATFQRGLEMSEKVGYERGSISLLDGIGQSYLFERDPVRAEEFLRRSLARAEKANQSDFAMEIGCNLGDAALLRHEFASAQQLYEQCRAKSVAAQDSYHEIHAEGGLARAAFESGALEEAQSHCERALAGIEAIRDRLRSQDLRTSFFASQHAYYDLEIQILIRLNQEHPDEGYVWQAFLVAERDRARTLLDAVSSNGGEMRGVASLAVAAQYDDVRRRLRFLEESGSSGNTAPGARLPAATIAAIARLTARESQLHAEVAAEQSAAAGQGVGPAFTLDALKNALPARDAVLIEYWLGDSVSYAWTIGSDGIRMFRLPSASKLEHLSNGYRESLLASASRDTRLSAAERAQQQPEVEQRQRRFARELAVALLPTGMLTPSTKVVFIVGDGVVQSIPFAALPLRLSGAGLAKPVFLSEPSAAILAYLENKPAVAHALKVAIFTAGQAASTDIAGRSRQAAGDNGVPEFTALPFAQDETDAIRGTFGPNATRLFSGSSISATSMQSLDWSQFNIAHFATHAVLNEHYAELNGLHFGDPQSGEKNMLWYGDICHLHAPLDLVVLSACNTARGPNVPGEGLEGLTQAFMSAGAQRVLGTLWEVDDQASSAWMRIFYRELKRTHSPPLALRSAQLAMARDPQWSDPYNWAGYVLAGDWRPLP